MTDNETQPSPTVLFVEDDALVATAAVEWLRDAGQVVIEAARASEALALIDANPQLKLVVTDIKLPDMNGDAMVKVARQRRPDLRVIFVTGYGRPAVAGLEGPATVYLGKPYLPSELADEVERMLKL